MSQPFRKSFSIVQIFLLASILAACSPRVDQRGHFDDEPITKQIQVDVTTKDEVMEKLGTPSSVASYGPETWYYISSRKETVAFMAPKIVEQNVTRIEFDSAGVVKKVDVIDKAKARQVALVQEITPTEGHSLGFFEQILGNLGRFNKPKDDLLKKGQERR